MSTKLDSASVLSTTREFTHISNWVQEDNIEIGYQYERGIVASAYDEGGVVWEADGFENFDSALEALDEGIAQWLAENT